MNPALETTNFLRLDGAGDNIRLVCDKMWDDTPRLPVWSASEGPQLVALRPAGAPEAIGDSRETPVKHLKGVLL